MGLLGFLKKGKSAAPATAQLVWFELQVTPAAFRFAFTPGQPVQIVYAAEEGRKAADRLISHEHASSLHARTLAQVQALVHKHEILYLPLTQADQAFVPDALKVPGVHIRCAYSDDFSWASAYASDQLPPAMTSLLNDIRALARQIEKELAPPGSPGAARYNSAVPTTKIKVSRTGEIAANGRAISAGELDALLDQLKNKGGELAYSREAPDEEPSEATSKSIQRLLESAMERHVPMRMDVEPDELLQ